MFGDFMDENALTTSEREWIASTLNKLPFVSWDRMHFLSPPRIEERNCRGFWLAVFGWIDREDAYKDFIILDFQITKKKMWASVFSCSSKKFSEEATKIIMGEGTEHNDCFRAERISGIKNSIKLGDE